jgi:hypothetical protein
VQFAIASRQCDCASPFLELNHPERHRQSQKCKSLT